MPLLNLGSSYSQIISPSDYNRLMSKEHLYIDTSDRFILKILKERSTHVLEVVELGCGPARVLSLTSQIENLNLTGIDVDPDFLAYSKNLINKESTQLKLANVEDYEHDRQVDIFYSQGFHHHISKGNKTAKYLENIYRQLKSGGYYILSDEFIPNYADEEERETRLVIWYSHIISHALRHNYLYLAQEEAKTLLDDLYEGRVGKNVKSPVQIQFTLSEVSLIDDMSRLGNLEKSQELAKDFLQKLTHYYNFDTYNDSTIDLSRGDYKICDRVLREEIKSIGFIIEEVRSFGPIETIGGMSVYVLKKED